MPSAQSFTILQKAIADIYIIKHMQSCGRERLVRDQDRDCKIFPRPISKPVSTWAHMTEHLSELLKIIFAC